MKELVLHSGSNYSASDLMKMAADDSLRVCDAEGRALGVVMSDDAWFDEEVRRDLAEHRDEIQAAKSREGGSTTQQLNARLAAIEVKT